MTRDEAIEAGARALFPAAFDIDPDHGSDRAKDNRAMARAAGRLMAAAVLDAIGWAGPRVEPGERVWGLVPVEGAIELDANEGDA